MRFRLFKKITVVLFIVSIMLAAAACQNPKNDNAGDTPPAANESQNNQENSGKVPDEPGKSEEPAGPEPKPYTQEGMLVAVGDIMMHSTQIPAAFDDETQTYSLFDTYFSEVQHYLTGDWVVGNLETPMAGEDMGGYAGYPMFNAPEALGDALKGAGFDLVSTANNHVLDRRWQGALRTLENIRASGLIPFGSYESQEAADQVTIVEKNEIKIAFLSYTYGTNGMPIPDDMPYLVNLIDEEKIKRDIAKARDAGADLVSVSMHWGYEYHLEPNQEQKRLARVMIEAGADIILGSHPHVIQPYEWIETTGADGTPRKGIVIYSMGNYISNQGPAQGTALYSDVGLIFRLGVKKHFPSGTVELGEVEAVPIWVHKHYVKGKRAYRVMPIEETLTTRDDPILNGDQFDMLENYFKVIGPHVESMAVPVSSN